MAGKIWGQLLVLTTLFLFGLNGVVGRGHQRAEPQRLCYDCGFSVNANSNNVTNCATVPEGNAPCSGYCAVSVFTSSATGKFDRMTRGCQTHKNFAARCYTKAEFMEAIPFEIPTWADFDTETCMCNDSDFCNGKLVPVV